MLFTKFASVCVLVSFVDNVYAATLFMAGDSTMAKGGGGPDTQGTYKVFSVVVANEYKC